MDITINTFYVYKKSHISLSAPPPPKKRGSTTYFSFSQYMQIENQTRLQQINKKKLHDSRSGKDFDDFDNKSIFQKDNLCQYVICITSIYPRNT